MTITGPIVKEGRVERPNGRIEIGAGDLLDLLTGAIIATGKDSSLPTLTGISLVSENDTLTATSTDRYRLITGKVTLDPLENTVANGDFTALLLNKDAEQVIRALKPAVKGYGGKSRVVIHVLEGTITFTLPMQTFNFRLLDGTFPKYEHLLAMDNADSGKMAFNCAYLGDFAKIPTGYKAGKVPVIFTFHGDNKLVTLTVAHPSITWRGGIMPMRYAD